MKNKANEQEMSGFNKVVNELVALKESKSGDYKNSWRVMGIQGLNHQLMRKITRIWINKDKPKAELNNEMLIDSYRDLAVYSIMCIQLLNEDDLEDKFLQMLKQ